MALASFTDPLTKTHLEYYIPPKLIDVERELSKKVIKENDDRVYVVAGKEGSGKSFFTFMQAKFIDPTFNIDRICFSPEQFIEQLQTVGRGKVVVFDEAFRGFSSKSSLSKVNKLLVQAMMEVRRRNLIIFIVLPSYTMLEKYIAVERTDGVFYIQKHQADKHNAAYRSWRCFKGKKIAILYELMKKNYGFLPKKVKTTLIGKFFVKKYNVNGKLRHLPYETFDEKAYDNKKAKAFGVKTKPSEEEGGKDYEIYLTYQYVRENGKIASADDIGKRHRVSRATVYNVVNRFRQAKVE